MLNSQQSETGRFCAKCRWVAAMTGALNYSPEILIAPWLTLIAGHSSYLQKHIHHHDRAVGKSSGVCRVRDGIWYRSSHGWSAREPFFTTTVRVKWCQSKGV